MGWGRNDNIDKPVEYRKSRNHGQITLSMLPTTSHVYTILKRSQTIFLLQNLEQNLPTFYLLKHFFFV